MDPHFFEKPSVIIDNGSGFMKVGTSGENGPYQRFSSIVGRKFNNQSQIFVGKNLDETKKALYKLSYPLKNGVVQNWDDMQSLWKYAYSQLKVSPKDHPVLLTEAILNSAKNRKKMLQIFFQKFQVPAVFIAVQGVLSLFGAGKSTGVALDSGDGVTQIVPVYEGFCLSQSSERMNFAGRAVSQHLRNVLRKSGINMDTTAQFQLVRGLKQNFCQLSLSSQKNKLKRQKYKLPDGQQLQLCSGEKYAGEILFSPEKLGLQFPSIPQLLANSLSKVDIDLRHTLYNEIILSGGNTMMAGFPQKLIIQMNKLRPDLKQIRCLGLENRDKLCWEGGRILSGLQTMRQMWITKTQFMENKEGVLSRKRMI